MAPKGAEKKARAAEVITREYTINLHKRLYKLQFKKRAPRAVSEIRKFAQKIMGTSDVRIDVGLNKAVWDQGITNPPRRMRVQLHRKRNEDEESENKLYTLVTYVPVAEFKGLGAKTIEAAEE
jgi:large subunit ribosomal protein L31e